MNTIRRKSAPSKTPVALDGSKLCKCGCGQPVGKGRRSWSGEKCVEEWMIANNAQHVRMRLRERDKEVCAKCGRDVARAMRRAYHEDTSRGLLRKWEPNERRWRLYRHTGAMWSERKETLYSAWMDKWPRRLARLDKALKARLERMKQEGWPIHVRSSWWEADHVVPVAEGGGQPKTLDAYRTLCWGCHRQETKALRARLSERKREQRKANECVT